MQNISTNINLDVTFTQNTFPTMSPTPLGSVRRPPAPPKPQYQIYHHFQGNGDTTTYWGFYDDYGHGQITVYGDNTGYTFYW